MYFHACMKQTVSRRRRLLVLQQQQQRSLLLPQQLEQRRLLLGQQRLHYHFHSQQQPQPQTPHCYSQYQNKLDSAAGGLACYNRNYFSSTSTSTTLRVDKALLDTTRKNVKKTAAAAAAASTASVQQLHSSSSFSSSSSSSGASLWWNKKRETTTTSIMTTASSLPQRWGNEAWLKCARDIWESNAASNATKVVAAAASSTAGVPLKDDNDDDDNEKIEALLSRISDANYQPLLSTEQLDLMQRLCRQRPVATAAGTDFMNQTLEGILFRPKSAAHYQQQQSATAPKALTLEYLRQTLEETCWKQHQQQQQQPGCCWQPNHDTFRLYIRIATDVFQDARAAQEILQRQWQYYYRALAADSNDNNDENLNDYIDTENTDDDDDDYINNNARLRWLHLIRPNRYAYTCVIQAWSRQAASDAATSSNSKSKSSSNNNNIKSRRHYENGEKNKDEDHQQLAPHQEIEKLIRELQDYYQQDCRMTTSLPSSSSSSSSFKPTEAAYIGWITALSCIDDNDDDMVMRKVLDILKELVENAQRDDFWPCTSIYNAVLFCILNSNHHHHGDSARQRRHHVALHRIQTAETLVGEMCQSYMNGTSRYCMPDTITFTTIMSAWNKTTTTTAPTLSQEQQQNDNDHQHHHVVDEDDEYAHPAIKAERLLNLLIDLYRQTCHASLRPNEYVWSCVINAWAKSSTPRAPQRAEELLYRMIDMHHEHVLQQQQDLDIEPLPLPNTVIFNSVLNAWARSSAVDAPERLEAIWRSMVVDTKKNDNDNQQQQHRWRIQIRPNALSYMARISVWERSHRTHHEMITKCRQSLNEMLLYDANHNHCLSSKKQQQQQGSDIPLVKHYNRVLLTLARAGRADEAEELVREMQSADAKPNKIVIQPNLITYNFLLLAWSKSKSPHAPLRAEAVLQEMMMQQQQQRQTTIQPDQVSMNTALTCWSRCNHPEAPERAWWLYTTVKNKCQVKPDTFTFGILLQAVARARAHTLDQKATMVMQLQQEMAREGIKADGYVQMMIEKCYKRTKPKPPSGSRPPMDEVGVV